MPELPEVETVANGVNNHVRGHKIISTWLGSKPEPFRSAPAEIDEMLTGSTIERVYRVGKHIVVELIRDRPGLRKAEKGRQAGEHPERETAWTGLDANVDWKGQWLVHLGMTGRLLISAPDVPVPPHTHAIVRLDDEREIRFVDPRRFGRLAVIDTSTNATKVVAGFPVTGKEPLDIPADTFRELFRGRRTPIKSALLDQKLLQGIGNIYADESLFRAGIRPRKHAGRLTRMELDRLHGAVQSVLREAIERGGSSVSDYVDADGIRGFFQLEHKVYSRTGEPCAACGTLIRKIVLGGRSSHYCPKCQR